MMVHSRSSNLPPAPVTVVFGADGFIGRQVLAGLRLANPGSFGVGRRLSSGQRTLDLATPDIRPLGLRLHGVTHAVIAAGIARIAECERDPVKSRAINVTGTVELARQLQQEGIRVVVLSSDYVFDGRTGLYDEQSPVNPLNEYGRQKVAMEEALLRDDAGEPLVVRLSKVYDLQRGSGTLLDEMAARLFRGETVRAAMDQYFCPTYIGDLVTILCNLLVSELTGILHLCAPTRMSRLYLGLKIAAVLGVAEALVQEILLRDLGESFSRPLDTSMVCERLNRCNPFPFVSMDSCLAELRANYGVKSA